MKMSEALEFMKPIQCGYIVAFTHVAGSHTSNDHFPDIEAGEPPIETLEEAKRLAKQFIERASERKVRLSVVTDATITRLDGTPIERYYTTP
jgi:fibrillarin-like rRNA methylase